MEYLTYWGTYVFSSHAHHVYILYFLFFFYPCLPFQPFLHVVLTVPTCHSIILPLWGLTNKFLWYNTYTTWNKLGFKKDSEVFFFLIVSHKQGTLRSLPCSREKFLIFRWSYLQVADGRLRILSFPSMVLNKDFRATEGLHQLTSSLSNSYRPLRCCETQNGVATVLQIFKIPVVTPYQADL